LLWWWSWLTDNLKGGQLYQVAAMGKGTKASASAETFVTSFRLK
jgi:hypothetical protein